MADESNDNLGWGNVAQDIDFHAGRARDELLASRRAKTETAALLHLRLSSLHMEQARALRQQGQDEQHASAA